jgi:hypothetical protein
MGVRMAVGEARSRHSVRYSLRIPDCITLWSGHRRSVIVFRHTILCPVCMTKLLIFQTQLSSADLDAAAAGTAEATAKLQG